VCLAASAALIFFRLTKDVVMEKLRGMYT